MSVTSCKIKCPHCEKVGEINKGFGQHIKCCSKLYENKTEIIQDYLNGLSLNSINKKYRIGNGAISRFLKENNVRVKSDENGRYKLHDNLDENFLNEIDSPEKAWFLGLMASDGWIKQENRGFGFAQSGENGLRLVTYVKNILKLKNPITIRKTSGEDSYWIGANSRKFVDQLNKYNIIPNKSLKYRFPFNLPEHYWKDFLRGYVEGDGSIMICRNNVGCLYLCASFVGNHNFIDDCLKVVPISRVNKCVCSGSDNVSDLRWHGEKAIEFCNWIFSTPGLYLSYKYQKYQEFLKNAETNPPKYIKYKPLKEKAKTLYNEGMGCMQIAGVIGVNFRTIYKWRKNNFI